MRVNSNEQAYKKGVEYFQQAIGLQPDYALAYAGLAAMYANMGNSELLSPREAYPKAEAAALRALEIDGTLPDAHATLGLIKFRYGWDWAGAEAEYRRAVELGPSTAGFHHAYGWYLTWMGRWAQASDEIKRAQVLDTLNVYNQTSLGGLFYCSHQFDRAIEQLQRTVAIFGTDPNGAAAHSILGKTYLVKRMLDAAIAEEQKAISIFGDSPLRIWQSWGICTVRPAKRQRR